MGHAGRDAMENLSKNTIGVPIKSFKTSSKCGVCVKGKMHKIAQPRISHSRSTECGEVVFSDVAGPFQTPSTGGKRFMVIFVDDFTRMHFVYFLQYKSETLNALK